LVSALQKIALKSQAFAKSIPSTTDNVAHAEISAINSTGLDGDCPEAIRQCIKDQHLIQWLFNQ
jgi:hypothetical protein